MPYDLPDDLDTPPASEPTTTDTRPADLGEDELGAVYGTRPA